MAVEILTPPANVQGINFQDAEDMAALLSSLDDGAFAGTGEVFADRAEASGQAHKFSRYISTRYNVTLRSRTWKVKDGWTFGIRPKDETPTPEAAAEDAAKPKK